MVKDSQRNVERTKQGCVDLYAGGVEVEESSLSGSVSCFSYVMESRCFVIKSRILLKIHNFKG